MNLRLPLFLLLLTTAAFAQSTPPATTPLTITDMQEDFDLLQKAIEEVHGGIYRHLGKDQVASHFLTQRTKLNSAKNRHDFISIVSETLAGLGDGHLRLEYDAATNSEMSAARTLPLSLALESQSVVVMFNETPANSSIKPGTELLSINGHAVKDLIKQMMPLVSGDGLIKTGKLWRIEKNFASYYWLFIDQASSFTLEIKNDRRTERIFVEGVTNTERNSNRATNPVNAHLLKNLPSPSRPNIEVKFHEGNVAQVTIGGFQGAEFKSEIDSVFQSIAKRKSSSVILDLRGNGGGVDEYGAYLVSQFTDKSFRYFDRIHLRSLNPSFTKWKADTYEDLNNGTRPDPNGGYFVQPILHSGVGIQQPGKYPFRGKVVVLLNGGTFSTAADVTATLHQMKRAVFVGEESAGGYEGNTSGLNARLTLPHSGLNVRISLYDYWNAVTPSQKSRGTIPDQPVENRVVDMAAGVDAQLSRALQIATSR